MSPTRLTEMLALSALALVACTSDNDTSNTSGVSFSYTTCTGADYWPTVLTAIQDGTGPWTVLTPSGGVYSGTLHSAKVGLLHVTASGAQHQVDVVYASAEEIAQYMASAYCIGFLTANGVINNLASGESAMVGLGWNGTSVSGPGNKTFSVSTTASTADLLAILSNAGSPVAKMILRRGVNAAALSPIDFTTGEAFAPTTPALTVSGTGGEAVTFAEWYQTGGSFRNETFYGSSSPTLPTTYWGVPAAKQLTADLHELYLYTAPAVNAGVTTYRTVDYFFHDPVARTVTFSPLPTTPTISVQTSSPYPRLRIQWQMPSGHKYLELFYYHDNNEATVIVTANYLGSSTVDVVFPDLSSVAGWTSTWMPGAGVLTNWLLIDFSWTGTQGVFVYTPTDGWQKQYNSWSSTVTP